MPYLSDRKLRKNVALWLALMLVVAVLPQRGALAQGPGEGPTPTLPPNAPLPEFGTLVQQCGAGVQPRGAGFEASGVLVTAFSNDALWVLDLDRQTRYPLPETRPCGPNCRPSPDGRSLLYVSPETATFWRMNPDGTGRQPAFNYYVSELEWWDEAHWLVWPTSGPPAIFPMIEGEDPLRFEDHGTYSIQPGGYYGLRLRPGKGEHPILEMVDQVNGTALDLAVVQPYFDGTYWSPDGTRLAFIGYGEMDASLGLYGAELYGIAPGVDAQAVRLTDLTAAYGAVRLTSEQEARAVSWSADSRFVAFWVQEIIGPDLTVNVGHAVIHVLDTTTGRVTAYCGFAQDFDGPRLPALVWAPGGRFLAFGVEVAGDERPALMMVLDTFSGDYTVVSEGMYPAYGNYDPVMWGQLGPLP